MSTSECIFCGMARDSSHEAPIYRDERVFVVRDINPKAPMHLLIIPNMLNQGIDSGQEIEHLHMHLLGGQPLGNMG